MSSRSDDRDEMARDLPGVCSSATNCLTHATDPDGTVWLSSTRRPDVRLRVDPDEWASRPATLGGPGEVANARHELDVLRGIVTDFSERLDLALGDLTRALAERDEARAELAKTVSNFEEFAESVADRRRPAEAAPGALDLDGLKALADAATPGPWTATANRSVDDANGEHVVASVAARKLWPSTADAEFIAAAREAVPQLIAEVERLRITWDDRERLNAELVTAVREVADLRALYDLQWKRMAEATARWRAEDPESRAQVLPDLGDLLQWLMDQRDQARADLADATGRGAEWMDEARRQAVERDREFQRAEQAEAERDRLRQHILDIDAHATPYGDIPDEPGWVGTYLVTAGALHRALGKIGHSAPKCEAEARLAAIEQHARDAGVRLLELQAERGELALALETVTAERDRRGDELRRARDVLVAAKVRAQVLRDLREFGSGAEGWPERDRISDKAVLVAVDALDHGKAGRDG